MNDQEIINSKIEKKEKTDIFLAYLLIIILLGCIAFMLYLKFFSNNDTTQNEHLSNYISLATISTGLNSSSLASELGINSSVGDGVITVTYQKDGNGRNIEMPLINNELEVTVTDEDKEEITKIYKEIVKMICKYYNSDKGEACEGTANNLSTSSIDGVRFVSNENGNVVYINIMKGIDVSGYTNASVTLEDVSKENTSNILVDNINVSNNNSEVIIKYNVSYKDDTAKNDFKLVISLYDENDTLLLEKTREYKKEDVTSILEDSESFALNETLKLEAVKKYSINITE